VQVDFLFRLERVHEARQDGDRSDTDRRDERDSDDQSAQKAASVYA